MDPDMDKKHQQSINNTMVFPNTIENNPHHRNIVEQIILLYGREILDKIRDLEKIRVKIKGESST
jgi:hypothetical protein